MRGLLSQFGDRTIHENLDLTVERGEVLGVVGGSGTGKTVLLNSIIGLKEPEGGTVSIFGHDTRDHDRGRARPTSSAARASCSSRARCSRP